MKNRSGAHTEEVFDQIAQMAALIADVPVSFISFIDKDRQTFGNPVITGDPKIRFYAGFPVTDGQGGELGTLCVTDTSPRILDAKQKQLLNILARHFSTLVSERQSLDIAGESRFRSFFENSLGLMCTHDTEGNFLTVNIAGASLHGYTREEVLSMSLFDLVPEDYHSLLHQYFNDVLEKGKASGLMNTRHKDGSLLILWYNNTIERDMYGRQYIISNSIDMTERIRLNRDLKKAKEMAEEASKAKSEFLANMSHEIRTPIGGVIGFTDLLLKTTLNDEQKKYLNIVNQSANALLGIINDILDFSKIEAGKLELNVDKTDLYELARQVCNIVAFQVRKKDLKLLLNINSKIPRLIWSDHARLRQILLNLVINAIKFTEKGIIEFNVEELSRHPGGRRLIRFEIKDTGIGIKPDKQKRIFEAFTQENTVISQKYGGTGLGLTISNKLLRLMDSDLKLISTPEKGSIFYFDLLLSPVTEEKTLSPEILVPYQAIAENPAEKSAASDKLITVLIAEDNAINMLFNKILVQRIAPGARILEAKNGREAIACYEKFLPDLILMDLQMPELNGVEATKMIRGMEEETHVPIIAITAGNMQGEREKCLAAGMDDFVPRPVVEETVAAVFNKWLNSGSESRLNSSSCG